MVYFKLLKYKFLLLIPIILILLIAIYGGGEMYIAWRAKNSGFDEFNLKTQQQILHSYDSLFLMNAHFGKLIVGSLLKECAIGEYKPNDIADFNKFITNIKMKSEFRTHELYGYAGTGFTPNSEVELTHVFGFQNGVPFHKGTGTIYADSTGSIISCNYFTPEYSASELPRQDILFAAVGKKNGGRYILAASGVFINEP